MRGFEPTAGKCRRHAAVLGSDAYPVGLPWGCKDPAPPSRTYGVGPAWPFGLDDVPSVPSQHFLQEDFPAGITAAARQRWWPAQAVRRR
jgi:hypothetical protein